MVKFSKHLSENENPVWRTRYINYEELKQLLYDGIQKAPKIFEQGQTGFFEGRLNYRDYVSRFDETFFTSVLAELDKVNRFYKDKTREMIMQFLDLKTKVDSLSGTFDEIRTDQRPSQFWKRITKKSTRSESENMNLKQELREFYSVLISLTKYQDLNYTGFRKLLRKHDVIFGSNLGQKTLFLSIDTAPFHSDKDVKRMIEETEQIYTTTFEGGSRAKAMKKLAVPDRDDKLNAWTAFKLGLMVGTFVVLFVVLAVSGILDPLRNKKWNEPAGLLLSKVVVRFYRGTAILTLYLCLLGINIYVWRRRGINHVYIFELDVHDNLAHHHFWNVSAFFGVIWAVSIVVFLHSENIGVPVYISPFVLHVIVLAAFLNPFPCAYSSSRKWLIKTFFRIFTAPFHRVSFADFWMCDQLSSLISIALDYQYIICFYFTPGVFQVDKSRIIDDRVCITMGGKICHCDRASYRHLIRAIPSILRLIQCIRRFYDNNLIFPHLVNGIKYLLSLLVVFFSALHALDKNKDYPQVYFFTWIAVAIISSLMSYAWDVWMDWGLFEFKLDSPFLGRNLMYPTTWFYYFAIVGDFFLRFSWAVALPLTEMSFVNADIMLTVTTPMEIFRRFVWNLFRLENEQIHNDNTKLANKLEEIISITSDMRLEEEEHKELLRLMDIPDGVPKPKRQSSLPIPTIQSRASEFSSKLIMDSKTELFTRANSQTSQADIKSNDNSSDEKLVVKKSFCKKLREYFCRCFFKPK